MVSRNEIIKAIQDTAKENRGVPLGTGAFYNSTGIKQSDWRGIHWARWNEAVIEAGFDPNSKTGKIDEGLIFEKLIPVVRYYKKLPTAAELNLYRRNIDKTLPAQTTFENRFRTRANIFTQLGLYVSDKPEYQDILEFCEKHVLVEKEPSKKIKEGDVYLFKSGNNYKIGKSSDLERRVKEIGIKLPESLEIIHTIKTDDPSGIEAYWHRRFADKRANGEWFKLDKSDIAVFKRRKFQ